MSTFDAHVFAPDCSAEPSVIYVLGIVDTLTRSYSPFLLPACGQIQPRAACREPPPEVGATLG
jgi:hypothetical protein